MSDSHWDLEPIRTGKPGFPMQGHSHRKARLSYGNHLQDQIPQFCAAMVRSDSHWDSEPIRTGKPGFPTRIIYKIKFRSCAGNGHVRLSPGLRAHTHRKAWLSYVRTFLYPLKQRSRKYPYACVTSSDRLGPACSQRSSVMTASVI
jgi:hypothetical protein